MSSANSTSPLTLFPTSSPTPQTYASDANRIFAIVSLSTIVPFYCAFTLLFYRRRTLQPIKARQPWLVIGQNVLFLFWVLALSLQRIFVDDWPCVLQLWQAYIGVILMANVYLFRSFLLYFHFNQTRWMMRWSKVVHDQTGNTTGQAFIPQVAGEAGQDPEDPMERTVTMDKVALGSEQVTDVEMQRIQSMGRQAQGNSTVNTKTRMAVSRLMLQNSTQLKIFVIASLLLFIPAVVNTFFDDVRAKRGDGCISLWRSAAWILSGFISCYLLFYAWVAWQLRGLFDSFRIKEELRAVAVVGLVCIIPWFVLNNVESLASTNNKFPYSTAIIFVFLIFAFIVSTVWPVRNSYKTDVLDALRAPENIGTFEELLSTQVGIESFKAFLKTEFSVENLLFYTAVNDYKESWREVDQLRNDSAVKDADFIHLVKEAQVIYTTHIRMTSPVEVNLPGEIVRQVESELLFIQDNDMDDFSQRSMPKLKAIYNAAQENIMKLMKTDSYKRYTVSEEYRRLLQQHDELARHRALLVEMNVLDE